jgi:hypothetical protein
MHGGKTCGFESAWKDDQLEDMSPANDFPRISNFYVNCDKNRGTKRHIVPESNTFYLRIRNKSMQKFFESHETFVWGASSIRVQPEPQGCSWSVRDLQEKPRGGSRGAVTRILSGR